MDDLELQPSRRPSEKLPAQPAQPGAAPAPKPIPTVQAVRPVQHFDAPPSQPRQPMNLMPIIVGVVALGAIGYFIWGKTEEKEVVQQVEVAKAAEVKRAQEIEREEETKKIERIQEVQREEAQKQREFALEKERIRAAEREALRQKNLAEIAAAQKEREALAQKRKEEYGLSRMTSAKNRIEKELFRMQQNVISMETEIADLANQVKEVEKPKGSDLIAAKNQMEYSKKKAAEARAAYQEVAAKFGPNHETSQIYKNKVDIAERDVERFNETIARAVAKEQALAQSELSMKAKQEKLKVLDQERTTLLRDLGDRAKDLDKLRDEPDYVYLLKAGFPIDSSKLLADNFVQLRGGKPANTAVKAGPTTTTNASGSPATSDVQQSASPGVTVATKKEKVTIYTMKDGKKISAVKAVDADDQLSLKTVDGKFVSIFKEDIVKQEEAE